MTNKDMNDVVVNNNGMNNDIVDNGINNHTMRDEYIIKQSDEIINMKKNYVRFAGLALVFAIVYLACMYMNEASITYPVFIACSFILYRKAISIHGIAYNKKSNFYLITAIIISISVFITGNELLQIASKLGVIILMSMWLLQQLYNDEKWGFIKYAENLCVFFAYIVGQCLSPISHLFSFMGEKRKNGKRMAPDKKEKIGQIVLGCIAAIPILFIVVALLASADRVFASLFSNINLSINLSPSFVYIMVRLVFCFFLFYAVNASLASKQCNEKEFITEKYNAIIEISFSILFAIVYVLFTCIQIGCLLFGNNVGLPDNYTYAEYAREGFFQLLVVCAINILIVILCSSIFEKNKILKNVLMIISTCTYWMIISAFMKICMYIKAYGLTVLRVLVIWGLVLILLLMTGIVVYLHNEKMKIFKYFVIVFVVLYIVLAYMRPDYVVAKYNVNNGCTYDEYEYMINNLSSDAMPCIIEIGTNIEDLDGYEDKNEQGYEDGYVYVRGYVDLEAKMRNTYNRYRREGIREFNLSHYLAVKAIENNN